MNAEQTSNDTDENNPSTAFPTPYVAEAPKHMLFLSEQGSLGATIKVEPWDGITPGQRFWLKITGNNVTGNTTSLSICSGEPLTSTEVTDGLSIKITEQQLDYFSEHFYIYFKVTFNGSDNENNATLFPLGRTYLTKKIFDYTNFTSGLNHWEKGADVVSEELYRIEVDSDLVLRYDRAKATITTEKTILYKNFTGLLPNRKYYLYICMKNFHLAGGLAVNTDSQASEYYSLAAPYWFPLKYPVSIKSANTQIRLSPQARDEYEYVYDMDDIILVMEDLPIPTISHVQTNLLFLNTIGAEGLLYRIAPWGALPGQKVWLTAYHDKVSYPLLVSHSLTEDEAREGISVVLHPKDLLSLSNYTPLTFILDITRDGSVAENDATKFKVLEPKLITDFISRSTFSADNWDRWDKSSDPIFNINIKTEGSHDFVRTTESAAHGDTIILNKTFSGLATGSLYKLIVPMRRVDLNSHAPSFSIQLSTAESKEVFTLTSMEWSDFAYSLYVPQASIRFDIISLDTPSGGSAYDIDDICLIKVDLKTESDSDSAPGQ
ncbi:hypothetical protein [Pseudomonas sp. PD9R]|uniref:hypothetical protein n=1 Tax=Pseudomonas sp. PD9R TaxID=2853534 RepID=UPI001C44F29D|nr:hypothetical protein [Pseudomonas sp. PD9R]MBV6823774.1 hypothetical protein [Pseudomonas sp. PD9R]